MTSTKKIIGFKSKNRLSPGTKASVKNWLAIAKDILDIAWRIVPPLSLSIAGLFLWAYLKHIQWSGLFYESAMTGTGLIFLVLAALALSTISFLVLSTPSILMGITLSCFDKKQKISREVFTIYLISLISWLVAINSNVFLDEIHTWILVIPIIITSTYGYLKSEQFQNLTFPYNTRTGKIKKTITVIVRANIAIFGIIFPIVFFAAVLSHYAENPDNKTINDLIILFFIPLTTLAPGLMYLMLRRVNTGTHHPLKTLASISTMLIYLTFSLMLFFTPASKILLESTEIYSNDKRQFQVLQQELKDIIKHINIEKKLDGELVTISAYVRYSFAGTKLICNEPLEFTDFSNSASKKQNNMNQSATLICIATATGDLREFRN